MPLLSCQIGHSLSRCLLGVRRHHSSIISSGEDADLPSLISNLVLTHSSTPAALTSTLSSSFPIPTFSPSIIDAVLKRLWNDGPHALLFFRALLRLPSFSPTASSFDHAIDIAARLRDRGSLRFLLSARNAAHLPLSHRTFSLLAERFANAGKPDRAVRLFLSLHHHGCRQDLRVFNSLLDVLCKSRRVRKATSLFKSFKSRFGADAITFNILAEGWCRLKRTANALDVLKEMVDSGLEPTLTTYNILLKGFFRAGQVKEGWEFFLQMKKRGRKKGSGCWPDVVSYTTVVHGLGLAGQTESASKVFDSMIVEGCLPSVETYNALIQVLCKKDCIGNALLVFDEMLKRGYTPNVITYNVVIRGLCHGGEMGRAMEFMEKMQNEGCKPNVQTYNIVIRHWCEEGGVEMALGLFGRMKEGGNCLPNLDTYNVVISSMFARKKSEDMVVAGRMVMEMVECGHLPRRFMFNKVLNGLLLTGNQDFAREMLRLQDRFGRLRREIRL
ncbi:pentatricopeptide repeat-containing protein At1g74900, mitochondrial [Phalaenopsis equestris]|uniref:pentatricopeptide repeat-containing protein At1g74900, mitochondrial n=1 Tax=Phalaenopsis equestris TaxID=78828 RepID=UPI0009E2DF91|nr:pentatricopeptide repeat-containing protein At1g74900, mitochondrial [Phalaenopsis equestris]